MPLISIETNQNIDKGNENKNDLDQSLKSISTAVADLLGKPESYLMLKFEHNSTMLFAGNNQPLAHIKVKSLGLPEDKTAHFSSELCQLITSHFNIPADRIYIEFFNPERHLWGWNSATF